MAKEAWQYYFEMEDGLLLFKENRLGREIDLVEDRVNDSADVAVQVLDVVCGPLLSVVCLKVGQWTTYWQI